MPCKLHDHTWPSLSHRQPHGEAGPRLLPPRYLRLGSHRILRSPARRPGGRAGRMRRTLGYYLGRSHLSGLNPIVPAPIDLRGSLTPPIGRHESARKPHHTRTDAAASAPRPDIGIVHARAVDARGHRNLIDDRILGLRHRSGTVDHVPARLRPGRHRLHREGLLLHEPPQPRQLPREGRLRWEPPQSPQPPHRCSLIRRHLRRTRC